MRSVLIFLAVAWLIVLGLFITSDDALAHEVTDVHLSWLPGASDNPLIAHVIRWHQVGGGDKGSVYNGEPLRPSVSVKGLSNGLYKFKVRALDITGAYSCWTEIRVLIEYPNPPIQQGGEYSIGDCGTPAAPETIGEAEQ
jgi:hypothetical protein